VTSLPSGELEGWTPIHVETRRGSPVVDWGHLGQTDFTDPFFEQTLARALRNPACLLFRQKTSIEALEKIAETWSDLRPSGLIFHTSRCGSTLLAQMLAALPHSLVLSEAPPIDQVLSASLHHPGATREKRLTWLRGLVGAFIQARPGVGQRCFIKFDSWHILELPIIRAAFPDVPWVFLYRDPVEVMVSQLKLRGTQMFPGMIDPRIFGLDWASAMQLPLDLYGARVLARIYAAGLDYAAELGGRLINFTQLPNALWETPGRFFDLDLSETEIQQLRQAAKANAKNPVLPYQDDVAAKQREASDELRHWVDEFLSAPYAGLETLRATQEKPLDRGGVGHASRDSAKVQTNAALRSSASSLSRNQSFTTQSITR